MQSNTTRNPDYEEYNEMMKWLGGEFGSEEFDLEGVQVGLGAREMRESCSTLSVLSLVQRFKRAGDVI